MDELTHVELVWVEKQVENWIRFGRTAEEHVLDAQWRLVSFAPGSIGDAHTSCSWCTLPRLICVSGLKPQLSSVRRQCSQSAGSTFSIIAVVIGV